MFKKWKYPFTFSRPPVTSETGEKGESHYLGSRYRHDHYLEKVGLGASRDATLAVPEKLN
jgi:hypothetical protein